MTLRLLFISTLCSLGLLATDSVFGESKPLAGKVIVDGSSTVFPISEAMGEEFQKANKGVQVAIAVSGTGGGFKKFCKGELDITGASRSIEPSEIEACAQAKIDFIELPVAYDGIAVVVNPQNTWAKTLTTAELKKIWEPGSQIKSWKDVRPGFPDVRLTLFGPGPDSGTFDYFTKVVNGKEKASRTDFTSSESDFTLVNGVKGDKGALGYFGIAYYESNKKALSLVAVDAGKGAVLPNHDTIASGVYAPLSRPLFIYVSKAAVNRPEVDAFANFYITNSQTLASQVGYVGLGQSLYKLVGDRLAQRKTGSMYGNQVQDHPISLNDLMKKSAAPANKR